MYKGTTFNKARDMASKKMECNFSPNVSANACVFNVPHISNQVVWFNSKRPTAGLIAHEAFHTVYHALSVKGLTLTDSSEEAYAYCLDWTIREFNKK